MKFKRLLTLSTAFILFTSGSAFASSFEEYVQRLGEHPQVESILAESEAFRAQAQGELGLPDPMVMIGVDNVPISDPAFDRFLPTSKVIGFSQAIPNPALRGAKSEKLEQMSEKQKLMADYTKGTCHKIWKIVRRSNMVKLSGRKIFICPGFTAIYRNSSSSIVGLCHTHWIVRVYP